MARLIKTDETIQEVTPANGQVFTLQEMQAFVGGYIEAIKLNSHQVMYVNEEGLLFRLPVNTLATRVLREHLPKATVDLVGDVLIATLEETGDE